jgi:hypothetical protein
MARRSTIVNGQFLLDQFSGAAAAYSLRRLRNAYTGSAIRVRRSSDNAEQDIGFTNLGVLNTAALSSFVGANSGFVTTWYDQSGNGRNLIQSTGANQPRIVNAGTNEQLGGIISLYFDDRYMINTTSGLINATNPSISVYSVLGKITNSAPIYSFSNPFTIGSVASGSFYIPFRANLSTNEIQNRSNGTNSRTYNTGVNFTNTIQVMSLNDNGTTVTIHRAGTSILNNTSTLGAFSESVGFSIGYPIGSAQGRWIGHISDLFFYTSDQSSNRTGIESNINKYYGI